ncbi:polysaccharide pyruvyl transferase family protein [Demequina sp.]|uniref:polysaccharide pyruvyl transferase family protein n=1 Tax=Demequina sp. TaxID=2050685 RepID=UPI003D0A76D0
MAKPLRLVIVSFVDDNFGDNLIRISFQGLLDVALGNHGLEGSEYEIVPISLKRSDENSLEGADAIFFAGGGLFGLSYLDFFPHVERITEVAERKGIPVIFSSMGLNNMSAEDGNADAIAHILRKDCVKAVAVRENLPLFRELVTGLSYDVRQVADPAVWTKYLYGMTDVVPDGTLGVNVVRSGLFTANKRTWSLAQELAYLGELADLATAQGLRPEFYTNGSLDDNKTLAYFAREYDVAPERVVLPQTTREVVKAISTRSSIAAIRMHSSIIAYSFGIPTIALAWNDKLPHFYEAIGHPERVIPFGEWSGARSFELLSAAGTAPEVDADYQPYLMSTYTYVFESLRDHVLANRSSSTKMHGFDGVASALVARAHVIDEDENDLRFKLGKAERSYLARFVSGREKDARIRELKAEATALTKQVNALKAEVRQHKKELDTRLPERIVRGVRRRARKLFGRSAKP